MKKIILLALAVIGLASAVAQVAHVSRLVIGVDPNPTIKAYLINEDGNSIVNEDGNKIVLSL